MDRNNSLNGRLSLSTSNLSSPIAESTHIGGLLKKFPWGGIHSPIKTADTTLNNSRNINDSIKKNNINNTLQRLDPRVYTDVQSQGLTSRIVKYYENSMKLNRSASVNNLYNKPGQFPVVHLKKNEIQYKPSRNRNNISIVRIAPPDKSVFQANSRSSILRSGSVVPTISLGLKPSNFELARANRPILHPAVENESAPTRSVLEDLKEISRKRINSDELDANDSIKKYCKEPSYELTSNLTAPMAGLTTHQNSGIGAFVKSTTKRHRELTSPSVSPNAKIPNTSQTCNVIKPRKVNNEFTSSISSSLSLLTPKRKYSEPRTFSRASSSPFDDLSPTSRQPKQRPKIDNIENDIKSSSGVDNDVQSVKTIPTLSATTTTVKSYGSLKSYEPPRTVSEPLIRLKQDEETINHKNKLTLFNKNYDVGEERLTIEKEVSLNEDENDIPKISFVKPKNQKANNGINSMKNAMIEKTQKSKLALMLSGLRGDLDEDQDNVDSGPSDKNFMDEKTNNKTEPNKVLQFNLPVAINSSKSDSSLAGRKIEKTSDTIDNKSIQSDKTKGGLQFPLVQNKIENTTSSNQDLRNKNPLLTSSLTATPAAVTSSSTSTVPTINFMVSNNNSTSMKLPVLPVTVSNDSVKGTETTSTAAAASPSNTTINNSSRQGFMLPAYSNANQNNFKLPDASIVLNPTIQNNNLANQKVLNNNPALNGTINNAEVTFTINSNASNKNEQNNATTVVTKTFSFGSLNSNSTGQNNSFATENVSPQQNVQTNAPKLGGFAFGNNLAPANNKSNTFDFSKNNVAPNSNSDAKTATVSESIKQFGNAQTSDVNPSTTGSFNQPAGFSFGNTKTNSSNSNMFASQQSAQTNSTFSFSASNKQSGMFSFGNNKTSENNQNENKQLESGVSSGFVMNKANEQTNTAVNNQSQNLFGSLNSNKPLNSINVEQTNSQNQETKSFQFGSNSPNTPQQASFNFKSTDVAKDKQNSVFGSNTFNTQTSSNANSTFSFGGNVSTTSPKNIFGSNQNNVQKNQEIQHSSIFGATAGPTLLKSATNFSFNNNPTEPAKTNTTTNASAGIFSFGGATTNNTGNAQNALNMQGASAAQTTANNSNIPKQQTTISSTFSFGTNNNANNTFAGNNNASNNTFKGINGSNNTFGDKSSDNKPNTFGGVAANTVSNLFGGNVTNNVSTSFGNTNQNTNTNNFGTNSTNNFSTNVNANNSTFSNPTNNSAGTFNFGQNSNMPNNNNAQKTTTAFSFGGSSNATTNSANSTFTFGNNNSAAVADNKSSAFNFAGGAPGNNNANLFGTNNANNANPPNPFNPGPNDRPIRKATRRLVK